MSLPMPPFILDPTVPRCAPRLPIIPSTFNYAKPVPEIPEPSLIFDYHNPKNLNPVINTMRPNQEKFIQPRHETEDKSAITQLTEIVMQLEKSMCLLQSQVDTIATTQKIQDTKLDEILSLLRSSLISKLPDIAAQTNDAVEHARTGTTDVGISTNNNPPVFTNRKMESVPVESEPKSRNNSGSSASSSSSGTTSTTSSRNNVTSDLNPAAAPRVIATKITSRPSPPAEDSKESVSMAIRGLRLPTVQESLFSENSLHTIDLEEFDNSMDDSFEEEDVSPCFDNPVKPTTTFYRKVIGNVRNNLLEQTNKEPSPAVSGSETTIYGMSPSNLSFATRQYLHKYGLTQGTRNNPNAGNQNILTGQSAERIPLPRQDRLLDLNALRNQPKLL